MQSTIDIANITNTQIWRGQNNIFLPFNCNVFDSEIKSDSHVDNLSLPKFGSRNTFFKFFDDNFKSSCKITLIRK